MDTIDRRLFREEQALRNRLVRGQHELLDQPVRDVARFRHDPDDEPGVVENDVGVREVEVDGAPRVTALSKKRGELPHFPEVLQERTVAVPVRRRRPGFQQSGDLRVRHAFGAPDHSLDELG